MDKNPARKDDSATVCLADLLKQHPSRTEFRESLTKESNRASKDQQRNPTNEFDVFKDTISPLFSRSGSNPDSLNRQREEQSSLNYKVKWEEAESRCRALENKIRQLENEKMSQLQEKIDELEKESRENKKLRQQVLEILASDQMKRIQLEKLKHLVNGRQLLSERFETICNKNDFHQQTLELREFFNQESESLLNRVEQILSRKRKRDNNLDDK